MAAGFRAGDRVRVTLERGGAMSGASNDRYVDVGKVPVFESDGYSYERCREDALELIDRASHAMECWRDYDFEVAVHGDDEVVESYAAEMLDDAVVDVIFQACQLAASARIDVRKMLAKRKDVATDGRIEKLTAYRPVKLTYSSNVGGDVR